MVEIVVEYFLKKIDQCGHLSRHEKAAILTPKSFTSQVRPTVLELISGVRILWKAVYSKIGPVSIRVDAFHAKLIADLVGGS